MKPFAAPDGLSGRTILQIIPELEAGGAERTTIDVTAGLVRAGARALVASVGGRLEPELAAAGGELVRAGVATKNPVRLALNGWSLAALIRRERVDLVHARSRAPAWSALMAARAKGVPFVTTYHGLYNARSAVKRAYNAVMARGDVVIANSRFTADHIRAEHPFAAAAIAIIPRGTDLARFSPGAVDGARSAALRAAWGVPAGHPIVLLPARLTRWKGHLVLLDAMARLAGQGIARQAHIVFAGDPQGRDTYRAELLDRAAHLSLAERLHLPGHVADIPAALATSAVVALPSTDPEAFGRSAVEAQAMGIPVVVADHGATPETVLAPPEIDAEGRTGWRVPPGDGTALATALADALTLEPAARRALAERARAHVAAQFSLAGMVEATLAVYARLLARNRAQTM